MYNYITNIAHVITTINDDYYVMIDIRLTLTEGRFPVSALHEFVRVTDANESVMSFMCQLSGNRKEMHGYFATDAFDNFIGAVTIEFGYGAQPIGSIPMTGIQGHIDPLNTIFAASGIPDAATALLKTIPTN